MVLVSYYDQRYVGERRQGVASERGSGVGQWSRSSQIVLFMCCQETGPVQSHALAEASLFTTKVDNNEVIGRSLIQS